MKIAVLGSYSTQIFVKELSNKLSKGDSLYEADYSSIDNEIWDYNSGLYAFCPNYLFIHETAISFKNFIIMKIMLIKIIISY